MKRFDQINVIPFIDIMLVLLVIVLTTATFVAQGRIPLTLPEAEHAAQPQPASEKPMEISIDEARKVYLGGTPVHLIELDTQLAHTAREQTILLRVDANVPFSDFVQVLDLLQKYHLERVSIVTVRKG
ncbi:MAG: biopolymer transporter ExbD [Halothiobacillaceae bacterium]